MKRVSIILTESNTWNNRWIMFSKFYPWPRVYHMDATYYTLNTLYSHLVNQSFTTCINSSVIFHGLNCRPNSVKSTSWWVHSLVFLVWWSASFLYEHKTNHSTSRVQLENKSEAQGVMWLLGLRGRGGDGATVPAGTVHARERGQGRLAPRGSQQLNCCFLLDYNWYMVLFYRDDWLDP